MRRSTPRASSDWLWWAAQWPILASALVIAVAGILRAGPAGGRHPRRAVIGGAVVAAVIWVAASGLFAVYVSRFGNYGAAWGSLSAVIVMLVWLWLTSLAILLGAQVEAEIERRAERLVFRGVSGRVPEPRRPWSRSERPVPRLVVRPLQEFLHLEVSGGLVLLAATVAALAVGECRRRDL